MTLTGLINRLTRWGFLSETMPVTLSFLVLVLLSGQTLLLYSYQQELLKTPPPTQSQPDVKGMWGYGSTYNEARIFIADKDGYGNGGMVSLASSDEPAVNISSYNLKGDVDVVLYPGSVEQLLAYLIHNEENQQQSPTPSIDNVTPIATFRHPLTAAYGEDNKLTLPLEKQGVWILKISQGDNFAYAFIVRSNTAVLAKEGDNQFIFWGQDLGNRRSITDGKLRLFDLKNQVRELTTAVFNEQGIATAQISAEADIALIERGDDRAILPINLKYLNSHWNYTSFAPKKVETDLFVFTDRPLYRPGDTAYFKAIAREDDDARYTIPQGILQIEVYQGWGESREVIYKKDLTINGYGAVDGEFTIPETASTGEYVVNITPPRDPNQVDWYGGSYTYFQVNHFRKPDFFIDISTAQDKTISGDTASFTLSGSYFSGHPLAHREIEYEIRASDFYEYDYYAERDFYESRYGWYGQRYGTGLESGKVTLDEKGKATVSLPVKIYDGKSKIYAVTAKMTDETGNSSEDSKNIVVYSAEFGIYRKNYQWGFVKGQELSLPIILQPHRGTQVEQVDLTVKTEREWWEKEIVQGEKYPRYNRRTETYPEMKIRTNENGEAAIIMTPPQGGSYTFTLTAIDSKGNSIQKSFYAWVAAEDIYYSEQQSNISIQGDQQRYDPQGNVTFTITSTIPDRDIFLSFERARVNRYQVLHMSGTTGTFTLPLTATDIPNIFAEAASFSTNWLDTSQATLPMDTDTKQLKVILTPDAASYGPGETVTVNVSTTDMEGTPKAAELALWAVDKSLFELVDEPMRDIFNTFWRERWNDTQEAHSLESILVAAAAEGGGCFAPDTLITMADGSSKVIEHIKVGDKILTLDAEGDGELVPGKVSNVHAKTVDGWLVINGSIKVTPEHMMWVNGRWTNAGSIQPGDALLDQEDRAYSVESIYWQRGKFTVYNIDIENYHTYFAQGVYVHNEKGGPGRTVFKDTAYWNPRVITDSSGRASIRFTVPDNLTTWTIAAIGATTDTVVGQNTQDIVVSKNVVVRPVVPNILRVGDDVLLSALVHNFTNQDRVFDVTLSFDSGDVLNATQSGVKIAAGDLEQISWPVKTTKENDNGALRFSAINQESDEAYDVITHHLPVRSFGFWETRGETGERNKLYSVDLADDADLSKTKVRLALSPTLVGTLADSFDYLISYPWGCVEQTTSRFVPAVVAAQNKELFAQAMANKDMEKILDGGVKRLQELKQNDGGWSWWYSGQSDPFITAYVLEYLLAARDTGNDVPEELINGAVRYFENGNFTQESWVAKIYALSLVGSDKGKSQLTQLDTLAPDILSWAVMANLRNSYTDPATNGVNLLVSKAVPQGDSQVYFPEGAATRFGSRDATTAMAIRALSKAQSHRDITEKAVKYLTQSRKKHYWSNTFATAQIMQALADFSKTGNELTPNLSYTIVFEGMTIKKGNINNARTTVADIFIQPKDIPANGGALQVLYEGEGQLYSTLLIKEFHTDKNTAALDKGIKVTRRYVNTLGEGYSLAVGDMVNVELKVEGGDNNFYGVIEDQLPAGLIPLNTAFKNEDNSNTRSYSYNDSLRGMDITENGMVMSLYQIGSGTTYRYSARVVNEGTFSIPPAVAELMYNPEIYGRTQAETIVIGKERSYTPPPTPTPGNLQQRVTATMQGAAYWLKQKKGVVEAILIASLIVMFFAGRKLRQRLKSSTEPDNNLPKQEPPIGTGDVV